LTLGVRTITGDGLLSDSERAGSVALPVKIVKVP